MKNVAALILAAGEGKRMKSKNAKVTHKICGRAMIEWVYGAVKGAGIENICIVVGHRADQVKACIGERAAFVLQEPQLGTGHAVMQAEEFLREKDGYLLVMYGDTPLITAQTIGNALEYHVSGGYAATVITAEMEDPRGYGRVVRDAAGNVLRIVEQRDATPQEALIREVNSGLYFFTVKELVKVLNQLDNKNDQGEYYLTDTLEFLIKGGSRVGACKLADSREIMGINDRVQLYEAAEIIRERILAAHMRAGVTVIDPRSTYVDEGVKIGIDTVLYPGTILEGPTEIGEDCSIGPNTRIVGSTVGKGAGIAYSVVLESTIGEGAQVGPFAYIRPESRIGSKVKIGDFVEIKKSVIGDKTKIPHLAYIGDAEVGNNTNIACGVITVNYNGKEKHKTIIGKNAFVGCNVNLIAPVEVKDDSYIAAGSTITEDVPSYSLAIARSRQTNKEDWVRRKGMERKEK